MEIETRKITISFRFNFKISKIVEFQDVSFQFSFIGKHRFLTFSYRFLSENIYFQLT